MPLEVRVSDEMIVEIYRAEDFFGGHGTHRDRARKEEMDVWEEMRANVVNGQQRTSRVLRPAGKRE